MDVEGQSGDSGGCSAAGSAAATGSEVPQHPTVTVEEAGAETNNNRQPQHRRSSSDGAARSASTPAPPSPGPSSPTTPTAAAAPSPHTPAPTIAQRRAVPVSLSLSDFHKKTMHSGQPSPHSPRRLPPTPTTGEDMATRRHRLEMQLQARFGRAIRLGRTQSSSSTLSSPAVQAKPMQPTKPTSVQRILVTALSSDDEESESDTESEAEPAVGDSIVLHGAEQSSIGSAGAGGAGSGSAADASASPTSPIAAELSMRMSMSPGSACDSRLHQAARALTTSSPAAAEWYKRENKRRRVTQEIYDSEIKYIDCLATIEQVFQKPMLACGALTSEEAAELFPAEIAELARMHQSLADALQPKLADWRWDATVADSLSAVVDSSGTLPTYKTYIRQFPSCVGTLRKLSQQNKKFLAMAEQATHDPRCAGLDLAAFLLTPIQRLPRYIMLLGRLMKYTDETHADYEQLLRALEVLQQLTIDLDKSFEESAKLAEDLKQSRKGRNKRLHLHRPKLHHSDASGNHHLAAHSMSDLSKPPGDAPSMPHQRSANFLERLVQRVPSPRKTRRSRLASKESNSSQISLASAGSASGASTEDLGVFLRTPERRMPPPMQAWGMAEEADAEDDDIMIRFQNSLPRNLLSPEGDAQDKAAEPQTPPQGSPEGRVRLRASASYHGSPSSHKPDSSSGVSDATSHMTVPTTNLLGMARLSRSSDDLAGSASAAAAAAGDRGKRGSFSKGRSSPSLARRLTDRLSFRKRNSGSPLTAGGKGAAAPTTVAHSQEADNYFLDGITPIKTSDV